MITTETPYKLAEIIRDTYPGLYRRPQVTYNKEKESKK
jgi:protein involved in polysaccharide export with SLBB domain